jgi:glycosyltransferase involved in cell wall biosynthesis
MDGVALVLGYNTALFNLIFALRKKPFCVNMDGVEWRRKKWGVAAKAWFYLNERIACQTATRLIADHPAIAAHLQRRRTRAPVTMIPYGAEPVTDLDGAVLRAFGLEARKYATVVARPEPENSILEIVTAFSRIERGRKLVVLGDYSTDKPYEAAVMRAASAEVEFPGPVYDTQRLATLRCGSAFFIYGHTVGGTSPTLVEALAAGSPCLCLDTEYSRWVAGSAGLYYRDELECSALIQRLFEEADAGDPENRRERAASRHRDQFTWPSVLEGYERCLGSVLR